MANERPTLPVLLPRVPPMLSGNVGSTTNATLPRPGIVFPPTNASNVASRPNIVFPAIPAPRTTNLPNLPPLGQPTTLPNLPSLPSLPPLAPNLQTSLPTNLPTSLPPIQLPPLIPPSSARTQLSTSISLPITNPTIPQPLPLTGSLNLPNPTVVPTPQATPRLQLVITPSGTPAPTPSTRGGRVQQFGGGISLNRSSSTIFSTPSATLSTETPQRLLEMFWPEGTPQQVQELLALRYPDGRAIIDLQRRDILLEIIGMLKNNPYPEVVTFLQSSSVTKASDVLWGQKAMDEGREKVAREISIRQMEEKGIKGIGKCRKCQSTELVSARTQTRSLDEPATVFVRCILCGHKWQQ